MAASGGNTFFYSAINKTFHSWTVLQLAVQGGFGGIESDAKAQWMVGAVEQWFEENANIEPYELEDFLAEILDNEFDTIADDGSLPVTAAAICRYYAMCKEGKYAELEEMLKMLPEPAVSQCKKQQEDAEEEDGDEEMDCSECQQPGTNQGGEQDSQENAAPEDDGWIRVEKRGKRR